MISITRKISDLAKRLIRYWRYSAGQISTLYCHPTQRRPLLAVAILFMRDQLYSRMTRSGLVLAAGYGQTSLLVSRKTAPGIHFRQVKLCHEPEEMKFLEQVLRGGDLFLDVG